MSTIRTATITSTISLHDALPISDTLFDRALGPLGYYGVFTANMHTDQPTEQPSDAAVNSAITRGIPVVSADRKSTRLNSSHLGISYAVFCLKKKRNKRPAKEKTE